jgi:small subunit ribosomal protein S4
MGRYTGPVERLSRREGVELHLKGERAIGGKSALARRGPAPPGQHGRRRQPRPSIYASQLRQKQRLKRYYGVRERQLRRYVDEAARRRQGRMGDHLLVLLERRLDNVVYRLSFATTRAQARQFVTHGHVLVDGRTVDVPSYPLRPGQVVAIRSGSPIVPVVRQALDLGGRMPGWLEVDVEALSGRMLREPARGEIPAPVDEQLIVEYFARR